MELIYRMIFEIKEIKKISQICGRKIFKPIRKYRNGKLKNKDFSIISNNCWRGVYQKLDSPYKNKFFL